MPSILLSFSTMCFQNCGVAQFKPEVVKYLWGKLIFDGPEGFGQGVANTMMLSQDVLMRSSMETISQDLRQAAASVTAESLERAAKKDDYAKWRKFRSKE